MTLNGSVFKASATKLLGSLVVYILGSIIFKDAFEASLKTMDEAARNMFLNTSKKSSMPYVFIAASFVIVGILLFFVQLP